MATRESDTMTQLAKRVDDLERQIDVFKQMLESFKHSLKALQFAAEQSAKSNKETAEKLDSILGVLQGFCWIGKFVKWATAVAASAAAIWAAIKGVGIAP